MKLLWDERAWDEYLAWQKEDKKTLKRINALLKDIQRSPYEGIGKPHRLSGDSAGWWSRRIDEKNRIVYRQSGEYVIIASCKGHYSDWIWEILRSFFETISFSQQSGSA